MALVPWTPPHLKTPGLFQDGRFYFMGAIGMILADKLIFGAGQVNLLMFGIKPFL